jgi:diguanylate cyclase (GGDEF)-like protein
MSRRLRIHVLFVIAVCVVGAGVASSAIQRSASNSDFAEFEGVTTVRGAMLAQQTALQDTIQQHSTRAIQSFNATRQAFGDALAKARARADESSERANFARQQRLADDWAQRADEAVDAVVAGRPGANRDDEARDRIVQDFLHENSVLLTHLRDKRADRQRRALLLAIGLVGLLTLLSGLMLWLRVERPARDDDRRRGQQDELAGALQVSRSEPEAYDVLARHLARSTHSTQVTILNRNNSADRLEPVTRVRAGSALELGLDGAKPDSCLAIRMAGAHRGDPASDALLTCDVCGKSAERTTCLPSLVGGEVIGSVLVEHADPFAEATERQIADSVAEAAPVIANLRNLAIAEMRAATDGLAGLPNQRAVHDTLKRMVAQAGRTVEPLALVLFDLDHFKQINDTFGHGRGDDVLAAVGDVAAHTVRVADFVGRLGGEEFAVMLPGTDREGARRVAENLREAIGALAVTGIERQITASFGVAVLPEDAPEAQALLRAADRALYQAKANGRDRVELAGV